jgi:hypothetical protein
MPPKVKAGLGRFKTFRLYVLNVWFVISFRTFAFTD